ncbi:MAG TPA: hypothetical protein PKH24_15950 [Sedimentisphaerales bacterium]|nr:hypothetical protein [Sedimentisphaerales bacterium]HNU29261.1 hypothetical protein [Sedimentisphaerales bacterium]
MDDVQGTPRWGSIRAQANNPTGRLRRGVWTVGVRIRFPSARLRCSTWAAAV